MKRNDLLQTFAFGAISGAAFVSLYAPALAAFPRLARAVGLLVAGELVAFAAVFTFLTIAATVGLYRHGRTHLAEIKAQQTREVYEKFDRLLKQIDELGTTQLGRLNRLRAVVDDLDDDAPSVTH